MFPVSLLVCKMLHQIVLFELSVCQKGSANYHILFHSLSTQRSSFLGIRVKLQQSQTAEQLWKLRIFWMRSSKMHTIITIFKPFWKAVETFALSHISWQDILARMMLMRRIFNIWISLLKSVNTPSSKFLHTIEILMTLKFQLCCNDSPLIHILYHNYKQNEPLHSAPFIWSIYQRYLNDHDGHIHKALGSSLLICLGAIGHELH